VAHAFWYKLLLDDGILLDITDYNLGKYRQLPVISRREANGGCMVGSAEQCLTLAVLSLSPVSCEDITVAHAHPSWGIAALDDGRGMTATSGAV
jgi:hypothetical protein